MYRFLLTPRWLGLAVVVLVLAVAAVRLGGWQFDRRDDRQAANVTTEANLAAEPVPVDSLVSPGDEVDDEVEWRVVTASGAYEGDAELYVRNQNRGDAGPGVSVVVPLTTDSGQTVLVERGWLSTASSPTRLPEVDPPPAGHVIVTGWLRRDSDAGPEATAPIDGTVRAVDSDAIGESLGRELLPGYIALTEQVPAADAALAPQPRPDLGKGPHFFYGLQWWFFALLAVVGYLWFAWSEAHPRRRPERRHPEQVPAPTARR